MMGGKRYTQINSMFERKGEESDGATGAEGE